MEYIHQIYTSICDAVRCILNNRCLPTHYVGGVNDSNQFNQVRLSVGPFKGPDRYAFGKILNDRKLINCTKKVYVYTTSLYVQQWSKIFEGSNVLTERTFNTVDLSNVGLLLIDVCISYKQRLYLNTLNVNQIYIHNVKPSGMHSEYINLCDNGINMCDNGINMCEFMVCSNTRPVTVQDCNACVHNQIPHKFIHQLMFLKCYRRCLSISAELSKTLDERLQLSECCVCLQKVDSLCINACCYSVVCIQCKSELDKHSKLYSVEKCVFCRQPDDKNNVMRKRFDDINYIFNKYITIVRLLGKVNLIVGSTEFVTDFMKNLATYIGIDGCESTLDTVDRIKLPRIIMCRSEFDGTIPSYAAAAAVAADDTATNPDELSSVLCIRASNINKNINYDSVDVIIILKDCKASTFIDQVSTVSHLTDGTKPLQVFIMKNYSIKNV